MKQLLDRVKQFQLIKPYEHECLLNETKGRTQNAERKTLRFNKLLWVHAPFRTSQIIINVKKKSFPSYERPERQKISNRH